MCGRRLKNEADCCLEQYLNCNVVLVDGPLHKILRSVNFPLTTKVDQELVPTMADMLGAIPTYINKSLPASDLTQTTQNTSSFSSTSSSATTEYTKPALSKQYSKSQQLNQIPVFESKVPRRSISRLTGERRDGNTNHLRFIDGEITNYLIDASLC